MKSKKENEKVVTTTTESKERFTPEDKEHLSQNKINLNNELMRRWGFKKKSKILKESIGGFDLDNPESLVSQGVFSLSKDVDAEIDSHNPRILYIWGKILDSYHENIANQLAQEISKDYHYKIIGKVNISGDPVIKLVKI